MKIGNRKLFNRITGLICCLCIVFGTLYYSIPANAAQIPYGGIKNYNYPDIEYNYAKLLQYSLYFYDANMCGTKVGQTSEYSWRNNCHVFDKTTYTRKDGVTVQVDLTGGFHDAGDAVKFGLPEAYSAFTLGMSYDVYKSAFDAASQTGHLQTITTYFADYLVNCAVLDAGGNVEAYCVQVGQGGGGYDHGYWGAPENQSNANRPFYFTSASEPSTDIVALSSAALTMQYKNFGGAKYLDMAKKLFAYAKANNKGTNKTAGSFYASSAWEDDYCLAALMLYQVTGDSSYKAEFDKYKNNGNAQKPYWPLCWDNVGPAVAYYNGNSSALSTVMNISNGNSNYDGYKCVDDWGSARYNTSLQFTGLLYDKMTGTNTYRSWAEGQMKFLLGNNGAKQCFVTGYNSYSSKYPHHRAASGYTGSVQGTKAQAHTLIGALVGGPSTSGYYEDSASNYQCNEVAIDYNATLVAASAAIYSGHMSENSQYIDPNYYSDGPVTVYNGVDYSAVYSYDYYITKYKDIYNAFGSNYRAVLAHFVNSGMKEKRQASAEFDLNSYKNAYADLRAAFEYNYEQYYNHYIKYGKKEGRVAVGVTEVRNPVTVKNGIDYSAVYDYNYYINKYPDVKKAFGNDDIAVLNHFVKYGMNEGRQAKADFNVLSYANRYGDLRRAYKNNLPAYYTHYMKYGKREGRKATGDSSRLGFSTVYNGVDYSAVFDGNYYVNKYSDIKKVYNLDDEAILNHFINCGMKEGRQAKSTFKVQNYKNRYADLQKAYGNNLKNYYMHYMRCGVREGRNGK